LCREASPLRAVKATNPTHLRISSGSSLIFSWHGAEDRFGSTADIACWFIDTAYDNRQFFVRHAYFLGDDDPYDKLRRALRADIDEAAWSSLNSTVSRPLPVPDSGCIAIKVINHYGDEILKVYGV
jgi:adenine-specific DNA-methyltransferase